MKRRLSPWVRPAPADRWLVMVGFDASSSRCIHTRTKRQALRHLRRLSAAGVRCYAEDQERMRDWPRRRRCWLLADGRRWDRQARTRMGRG